MPRMRGRLYSSCASSTWSLPSAVTACWAKMSRISCVRSTTRASSAFSRKRCCDGSSSSSTSRLSASLCSNERPSAPRACPCRRRCAAPAARGAGRRGRPARRPAVRASSSTSASSLSGSAPCASTARTSPRSGSGSRFGCTWNHRAIMPPAALAQRSRRARTLELVDIPSPSRARTHVYRYVTDAVPLDRVYDDGESVLYRQARGQAARAARRAYRHGPGAGQSPRPHRGRRVHGLGATDMKGGLAVMIELARWAAEADLAYDLGLLFFPREELGPADNPLPGRVRGGAARGRGRARDLPRADRQHAPARLPRQPQRPARVRGPLGALGAAVAGRERRQARGRRPARAARARAA